MKRKNGFTLIELLAIILILAIIAVITVPIILNIIDNAERNSVVDSAYGYKDALQKYYTTKLVQNPEQELPSGYLEISELPSDFTVSGEIPSDGWVKLKKGVVERYSLKYKDYVVTMDNDKNITSQKQDKVDPHVTNDYQEVEYLESNGTQYIDTGYIPKHEDYLELKNVTRKSEGALFSAGTGDYQLIYLNAGPNNYFKFFATGSAANFQLSSHIDSKNIKVYNNNLYIDDQLYTTSNPVGDVNTDLRLFARANGSSFIGAQIGNVIIKSDNSLVRNLIPVVRKNDNKPGMLDLANYSENLFNPYTVIKGRQDNGVVGYENGTSDLYVSDNTIYLTTNTTWRGFTSDYIAVSSRNYNIYVPPQSGMSVSCSQYDANKQFIKKATLNTQLEENCKYIRFTITFENVGEYQVSNIMLNEGSEALPYESYGYKFYTNSGTGEFIAGPEI